MPRIPDNTKEYILSEIDRIEFGKVTVELNGTSDKVYVVSEQRQQFEKAKNKTKEYEVKQALHRG